MYDADGISSLRRVKIPPCYAAGWQSVDKPRGWQGPAATYVQSGSDDMYVRTDENPEVFVLCGFRRPGANARAKPAKLEKVEFSHFFDSLKCFLFFHCLLDRGHFYRCSSELFYALYGLFPFPEETAEYGRQEFEHAAPDFGKPRRYR